MNPFGPGGDPNQHPPYNPQQPNPYQPSPSQPNPHQPNPDPFDPNQQQRPPRRRRGWLSRNWKWYDRYSTARDVRNQMRPRRSSNDGDGDFGGGGSGGGSGGGGGGGGRGGGRGGDGDGCGCDGCGCDLFHLSVFQVLLLTTPTRAPKPKVTVPARAGATAIRGYQRWLSHRLPTCCPHTPTCSHYGLAVLRRYGLLQGARLAGGRIARCTSEVPRGTEDPPP